MMLVGRDDEDDEIGHLYELPLDEFTAARNALAKRSKNAAQIRALGKPPLAAWGVNQVYWKERSTWDALIDAAENLRKVNKAVLGGRSGDVRAAGAAHDAAVHDALKAALGILTSSGHPPTDAVRQAVLNTLRALPADEPAGRLTRTLQPGGFEMLAGLSIPGRAAAKHEKAAPPAHQKTATGNAGTSSARSKADARALTAARETAAATARTLREAEQAVRRHEFEIARAARDEERTARSVEQARAALDAAKTALAEAEREQKQSAARRQAAEQAAHKAASAVTAAQRDAAEAASALKKLDRPH